MNSEQLAKLFEKASHGSGMFELWDAFITTFAASLATATWACARPARLGASRESRQQSRMWHRANAYHS